MGIKINIGRRVPRMRRGTRRDGHSIDLGRCGGFQPRRDGFHSGIGWNRGNSFPAAGKGTTLSRIQIKQRGWDPTDPLRGAGEEAALSRFKWVAMEGRI